MKTHAALELSAGTRLAFPARIKKFFIKFTPAISSYLLATLFIYAAYNKLIIYNRFVDQLHKSPLIKELPTLVNVLGISFSIAALGLTIYKRTRTIGLWSAFGLLLAYTTHNYVVVPYTYPVFLSWVVPGSELLIAAALLLPRTRQVGLWSAFYLMVLFTAYVFVLKTFFKSPGCSCGGIISQLGWLGHFYFNLGFTLLAGLGLSLYTLKKNTV